MTPEELEALEARAAKLPDAFITACIEGGKAYVKVQLPTIKEMHDWHDFILDAPKNVPALIAEVRRLREDRALLEMAVEALEFYGRKANWTWDIAPDPAGTPIPGTSPVEGDYGNMARATLTTIKTALE